MTTALHHHHQCVTLHHHHQCVTLHHHHQCVTLHHHHQCVTLHHHRQCVTLHHHHQCVNVNTSYIMSKKSKTISSSKLQPTRCNVYLFIYLFLNTLYMFQAVPPPIIRSTQLYKQLQVLSTNTAASCYRERWQLPAVLVDNTWSCLYSCVLLTMGGKTAWNM
jgi:hypothetical protein